MAFKPEISRKRFRRVIFLFCCLAALAWQLPRAPRSTPYLLADISGHLPDLRFSLVDDTGRKVKAEDYRGKAILLYFGFAGCSTQCPLTLARLARLLSQLGSDEGRVRVLFVTVNPENDTPSALRSYLSHFGPRAITGLTGSAGEIGQLAQRLRAAYRPDVTGNDIPHSNILYIFDAQGQARLLAAPKDDDKKILHDLRQLIHAT